MREVSMHSWSINENVFILQSLTMQDRHVNTKLIYRQFIQDIFHLDLICFLMHQHQIVIIYLNLHSNT